VSHGHYDPDKWLASFIGIVPADKPRLVIAVIIDEPQPEHLGGKVAAPVWKEIAEASLKYLSVPPSEPLVAEKAPDKPAGKAAVSEPTMSEGLGSDLPTWEGLEELDQAAAATLAEEETVAQDGDGGGGEPGGEAGDTEPRPDVIALPSFAGMSVGEAIRAARRAGVEIAPEGSGLAVAQSPGPGPARRGVICRVSFRPGG
jgi:hypothetical protein